MSHCFNPHCDQPYSNDDARFCPHCGMSLLLANAYRALHPLGEGGSGRTFLGEVGDFSFGRGEIRKKVRSDKKVLRELLIGEGSPLAPLEKGGTRGKVPLAKGDLGGSAVQVPLAKRGTRGKVPLAKGDLGGSYCAIRQLPLALCPVENDLEVWCDRLRSLGEHPQLPAFLAYLERDGYGYLIQEWIEGESLALALKRKGVFTEPQIWRLLREVLPVLQHLHAHRILHRDIKPENIVRRRGDRLCLVDFGTAMLWNDPAFCAAIPEGNEHAMAVGSVGYAAPEQLRGNAVPASDLYSLGVTCIHLLTRVRPFDLIDDREGSWHWREYVKTPVSEALGQILDKAIAPALNQRYQSAGQMLKAIRRQQTITNTVFLTRDTPATPLDEVKQALHNALTDRCPHLRILHSKDCLTLAIAQPEDRTIDYAEVAAIVTAQLQQLSLPEEICCVRAIAQVANRKLPEWQQIFHLQPAPPPSQLDRWLDTLSDRQFWLTQISQQQFWMNLLLFVAIQFTFGARIVLLHPAIATMLASGFLFCKHRFLQHNPSATKLLTLAFLSLTLVVGFLPHKIEIGVSFATVLFFAVLLVPVIYPGSCLGRSQGK